MKKRRAVVALDQGSSSSRAIAFDLSGKVLARAQKKVRLSFPRPGFVEQDPRALVSSLSSCLDRAAAALPSSTDIAVVGLAAQRSTVLFWDAADGRPAGPALSWMDGRAAGIVARHADMQKEVHSRTGLYLTPYYSAPKICWALENDPGLRDLAKAGRLRVGPVSAYILWSLTGGKRFLTDPAMAQRMLLYNVGTGDWDPELMRLFGIERSALPDIIPSTGDWGTFSRKGREYRLGCVLGDQQAAAYGQGVTEAGSGVLNYGTGAFFLLHIGESLRHVPGILTSVAWETTAGRRSYFLEGTVHAAGTSFDWLKENLGLLKDARDVDAACRKSTHRIFALQAIGGLGAPRWDYSTPTSLVGLRAESRPADVVRAVTESIAFLISDIVGAVRASGAPVGRLKASGGLARVGYLLQFQADLLGMDIERLREREATAAGAASMAAEALGLPGARRIQKTASDRRFSPEMPEDEARKLLAGWRAFVENQQKTAKALKDLGVF